MNLTFQQLSHLQKAELEIFKTFLSLCLQLNLTYYILGGTLLGAVRHGGFIPWDDDIDVGMPRQDYMRFLQEAPALLPKDLFLQTFRTDPEFYANFTKLRNNQTTFLESSWKKQNIHHGIAIDIFPLDFCPTKGTLLFSAKALLLKLRILDTFPSEKSMPFTRLAQYFARICYPSIADAVAHREILFVSTVSGDHIANHCGAWGKKETVPAHWYGEGTVLSFEGLEVRAPSHYHAWLTQVYGNYLELPPEEKRVSHHKIEIFDPDRPYTFYVGKELT